MKHENVTITKCGSAEIKALGNEEQREFYLTLLARILELHRQQKEGAD